MTDEPPNIEVHLTDPHEFHCFRLTFHAKHEKASNRFPVEILLHTTQAIDLVHKLSLAICEKHHQDSAELIRVAQNLAAAEHMAERSAKGWEP